MSQWTVEPVMPGWGILLIVLGLFGLLAIKPSFGGLGARQLLRLRLLRSGVIVLLAVGLVRPGCVRTIERPQRVVIPLAIDLSRSMELPHAGDSLSRWQKLQQTLRGSRSQLNQLSERYDVKYFGFDGELIPLENVQGLPQLPALPEGSQTDYGQALDAITRQMRGERMAAAFIFGDGVQNTAYPKVEMARVLREFGELQTPLLTVPFGQAAEGDQIADIAMTNLPDQFAVFVKNELQIQGVVRVRGFVNQAIPIELVQVNPDGSEKLLRETSVMATRADQQIPINLTYAPDEPGEFRLVLRAVAQDREVVVLNNELPAFLTVYEGGLRVLYIEGELNFEQRYLRRSLASSQDIEVDFLWIDHRNRERWPVDISDQLSDPSYDVFLIGDLDSRALHQPGGFEGNLTALAAQIEQGKGLVMMGGEHSFGPGRYHSTPLADLLPIQMQPYEAQDFGAPVNMSLHLDRELELRPAEAHYLTRLSGEENPWPTLPKLQGANRFTSIKPRAQVLLETERGEPILVVGDVGGRVVAFAGDTTWRWWTHGQSELHRRFWRQMILWAAGLDGLNRDNVVVQLPQRRFAQGTPVTFSVSAREASGDPLPDASFTGEIVKPNGLRVPLVIPDSGADRIVSFEGTELDQSGLFAIEVKATLAGRDVGSARVEFVVFDADSEKTQPAANPEQLAKMAFTTEAHGGQLLEPDRLSEQIQRLLDEPVDLTIEYPQRRLLGDTLWDGMLYMLGVVGLLGSEWFFRKRWGLV